MKKLSLLVILLFSVLSMTVYAQSGGKEDDMTGGQVPQHQMSGSGMMDHGKEMMQKHQGEMGDMHMMKGKEMHQKMSPCMGKMQNMMRNMNKMMEKEMDTEDRAKMADIMKDMSNHMMGMSMMMKKGHCTMDEMNKMNKDISDTEKSFEELDNYL